MMNMQLDKQQWQAVYETCDPGASTVLLGGPGTGKSTCIQQRVAYLVHSMGVAPSSIIVVSFTKGAAHIMKKNLRYLGVNTKGIYAGSFNSVCYRFLKMFKHLLDVEELRIINPNQAQKRLRSLLDAKELNTWGNGVEHCQLLIAKYKHYSLSPTDYDTDS